ELATAEDAGEELPYDILTLWHNSFDDIVAKVTAEAQLHVASVTPAMLASTDAAAVAADVKQGRTLRFLANKLSMNLNSGFDDLVVCSGDKAGSTLDIGEKLSFLVLGPRQAEIDALEQKWAEDVGSLLAKEKAAKKKSAKKKSSVKKQAGGTADAS